MNLVDTSVWINHFRKADSTLVRLLTESQILVHPSVVAEIALGSLRHREKTLRALLNLPRPPVATDKEILAFIERHGLAGRGIGYVDAHLVAATTLVPGACLWTLDRRLKIVAAEIGITTV